MISYKKLLVINLVSLSCIFLASCGRQTSKGSTGSALANDLSYQPENASTTVITIKHQDDKINIKSNEELLNGLELNNDERGCYVQKESKELKNIRICQTPAIVSVFAFLNSDDGKDYPVKFVLKRIFETNSSGDQSKNPVGIKLETPKAYTLKELIEITKQKSFTNRQELDQLKTAKDNMKLHYLNLLPHLSINSALALATFSGPLSILGAVGDLLPFLLPNRWIQAKETEHIYKAEVFGSQIAVEDSVQLVEGMALSIARDQQLFDQLVQYRSQFIDNIKFIRGLEETGKLPIGRSRDIESPLTLFDQMNSSLADIITSEQAELAFAVGFHNPDAIKNIDIGNLLETIQINEAKVEADAEINEKVLATSLELFQIDEMIKTAALDKKEKIFEWLDPAGDSQAGLGFGLPMNIALSKDNMKYFNDVKEQLSAMLVKKINLAQKDYALSSSTYQQSLVGVNLQTLRLKTAIEELMVSPNDTPVGEIQDALNQLALQQTNLLSAQFSNLIAKSRINRLLHRGIYQASA
ncbi:MAG: hypothetical protein ACXVCE_17430, partial [Bacteriovorax sp.]